MTKLFGTNGIRGIVNQDMNCDLAYGIGKAWGTYFRRQNSRPNIAIGTDARLSNGMLKSAITSGLLSVGCDVVDIGLVPTPVLQYTVKQKEFDSGVIITASHNPPQFNGIKGVGSDGTEFYKNIEEDIEKIYFERSFVYTDWQNLGGYSTWSESRDLYINGILSKIDEKIIKQQNFHVILDCGNGVGGVVTPLLLKKLGCKVTTIFETPDGSFPERNSEPIPENLNEIINRVKESEVVFGVAQDGDADRSIFIDENGTYLWGDKTLSLAGKYITKTNNGGICVTPVTTSTCFEDVILGSGGQVIYTKVGSPIVAKVMKEKNAIFGGEENGGLIFPELHYCRDSCMSIAKILEILAKEKKSLSELIKEIPNYEMYKTKLDCPNNKKEFVLNEVVKILKDDEEIIKIDKTDGIKSFIKDGWILMRPSGTEPIFRVYVESIKYNQTEKIALKYKKIVGEIIQNSY
jgi:phosphomannomutase/phosphoglucomutase